MKDVVENIFYFGVPEDGFKVYPNLGAVSNNFSGYYTKTEKADWILISKKTGNITQYTHVRYGLLTSSSNGRAGSCLGISINFIDYYFADLELFRKQIIELIWDGFLHDKELVESQQSTGRIVFKSFDFLDVKSYLDEMSNRVRGLITKPEFSNYLKSSQDIPDAEDKVLYSLHNNSSPKAIIEYFKKYGIIKISPISQVEEKSFSERDEEHKRNLEIEVNNLTDQIKQKEHHLIEIGKQKENEIRLIEREKNKEIEVIKQKLDTAKVFAAKILKELSGIEFDSSDSITQNIGNQSSSKIWQPFPQSNINPATNSNPESKPKLIISKKHIITVAIVLGLFSLLILLYSYVFTQKQDVKIDLNKSSTPLSNLTSSVTTQKSSVLKVNNVIIIKDKNNRQIGFLNTQAFLEKNKGKAVKNMEEFKEILSNYLFENDDEVTQIYENDRVKLWNKILELNTNSPNVISDYCKKNQDFKIENSQEQQNILKDLVIYTKN